MPVIEVSGLRKQYGSKVAAHLLHIYAKLGVNDRAAAVAIGFERGLRPRSVG
jgi:hypothetical protein